MSRPTKLNHEVQAKMVQAMSAGNTIRTAAHYAGVSVRTVFSWMKRGREEGEGPHVDFLHSMERAQADAIIRNVAIIQRAAGESWQAAGWWLERRHPEEWSRESRRIAELERLVKALEAKLNQ